MAGYPVCLSAFALLSMTACSSTAVHSSAEKTAKAEEKSAANLPSFQFSVLPRSFQANPLLDMTVFTEVTLAGRAVRPPTPENPVYYVAQPDGFRQLGNRVAGEKPPPLGHIDFFVRKALASGGYRAVPSPEVRPALMILYRWGTHNSLEGPMSEDFPRSADADVLERARLVGGAKLVREIDRQMEFGSTPLDDSDEKMRYLKEQAFDSCYFVVLFAYDYDAMIHGERRLYWRTNMTVNSNGVSVRESLLPLIASAGPFFGRETLETAITSRPLRGRERIEIGPMVTVEEREMLQAGAAAGSSPSKP